MGIEEIKNGLAMGVTMYGLYALVVLGLALGGYHG